MLYYIIHNMPYFKLFVFLCLGVSSGQQAPIAGGSTGKGGSSAGGSSAGGSSAGVTTSTPESSTNNNADSVLDFLSDLLQNNTLGRPNCSFFTCGAACQGRCGWSSTFNRCLYGAHTRLSEMNKGPGCSNSTTSLTSTFTTSTLTSSTLTTTSYTLSSSSAPSSSAPSSSAPSSSAPSSSAPSSSAPSSSAPSSSAPSSSAPSSSAPSSSAPSSSAPSSLAPSSVSRFSSNNFLVSNSPTDDNATDIVTNAATDIDTDDENATDIDITAKGSTSSQSSNGNSSNIIIFPITAFILLAAIVGLTQLRTRQKRDISENKQPYSTSPAEIPNFYAVPNTRIRQRSPKTNSIVSDHSYYEQPVPLNKRGFVVSDVYGSVFSPQNYYETNDNGFYDNVNDESQYDLADTEQMATYDLADTEQMATYDLAGSDNFYDATADMNVD